MTKLKQIENYPTGDCMRTVFACLLDKKEPTDIPNFMRDGSEHFNQYMQEWLEENNLEWVELTWSAFCESPYVPIGYCGISGKSPRGDWDHIVVGECSVLEDKRRQIKFIHDTSPFHDGKYIDGDITLVGFLLRKLNNKKGFTNEL